MSKELRNKINEAKTPKGILLQVKGLKKYFPVKRGFFQRIVDYTRAVDKVDFYIREGETLGLVGESGSGKTTLGRSIIRLIEPTEGSIIFRSKTLSNNNKPVEVEITKLSPSELKIVRKEMAYIFQDPISSLDPRMRVGDIVREPLEIHSKKKKKEFDEIVSTSLETVGLSANDMRLYPHEFSGGQRQRIGIARALILNPRFLICDEPTSALDISIQGQILNLLQNMQKKFNLTYFFISHDLAVIQHMSDRIAVMYSGTIVEIAEVNELYKNFLHPYTELLLSAILIPDPDYRKEHVILREKLSSLYNSSLGCSFYPRCRYKKKIVARQFLY